MREDKRGGWAVLKHPNSVLRPRRKAGQTLDGQVYGVVFQQFVYLGGHVGVGGGEG